MNQSLRRGRVIWYDANHGYGFIHGNDTTNKAVFITKNVLDAFGITGLQAGLEIVFDVVKGQSSDRVKSIIFLSRANPLH